MSSPFIADLGFVIESAKERAKDGISLSEALQILSECGGLAVKYMAAFKGLTGEAKKAAVDAAILGAYHAIKPLISVGWLTPLWFLIDPIVVAAIPRLTEAAYQMLKPHLGV